MPVAPQITEDEKLEMLRCIINGRTILEACAFSGIDPFDMAQSRKQDKTFDKDIRDAQAFRVECMADSLIDIHQRHPDPKMAGVISKNIQWLASKRMREIYGDKVDHNVNVQVDIRAAMLQASQRVIDISGTNLLIDNDITTDNISVMPQITDLALIEIKEDEDVDPLS